MSNRIKAIKIREAKETIERTLELAEKHPIFEAKFLDQAIEAENLVKRLEAGR